MRRCQLLAQVIAVNIVVRACGERGVEVMHAIFLVDSMHLVLHFAAYPYGTSCLPVSCTFAPPIPALPCCLQDPEHTWELVATCLSTLLSLDDPCFVK